MIITSFSSIKPGKFLLLNLLGMFVVVVAVWIGIFRWCDSYTRHGEAVLVPDVIGMQVDDAQRLFVNNHLTCVVSDSTYMKNREPGCIIDVHPAVSERVKEGRVVYLTINSKNIPLQMVPDVADNSSYRQAEALLRANGFQLDERKDVPGEKDWVYGVEYQDRLLLTGEKVPMGSTLVLIVGNGTDEESMSDSLSGDSLQVQQDAAVQVEESAAESDDSWF